MREGLKPSVHAADNAVMPLTPGKDTLRRWPAFGLLLLLVLAVPVNAGQPKCPLPLGECMAQFGKMRERPWLGVEIDNDAKTGLPLVKSVKEGSPAEKAGVKPGDTLIEIGGVAPQEWFAGRAGWKQTWKDGDLAAIKVGRGGKSQALSMAMGHISEETLAQVIGIHVLEAHLAYMDEGQAHEEH
jgi:membrane-associated protease RseP (regulator of RpoE activity)